MISVVVFSAVILGLAGLSFQVARRSTRATDQALMMSVLLSKVDRASIIDFDSLETLAGCDSTLSGVVAITACTSVSSVSARIKTVQIVAQTSVAAALPDTITFNRGDERRPLPLK